jgi:hypothetical protein
MYTQPEAPGTHLHELARRCLFLSIGGIILWWLGSVGLRGWGGYAPLILGLVIGALLLLGCLRTFQTAQQLPQSSSHLDQVRRWYKLITGLEYAGFFLTFLFCNWFKQPLFIAPIIVLVSGLHFLALGPVLRTHMTYVKGVVLPLLAILTMAVLPQQATFGQPIWLWYVVPGFLGALLLYGETIVILTWQVSHIRRTAPMSARSA